MYLAVNATHYIHAGYLFHALNAVLQFLCIFFDLIERKITRQVDIHDRLLINIKFLYLRVVLQVTRQVLLSLCYSVRYFLFAGCWVFIRTKFNRHD